MSIGDVPRELGRYDLYDQIAAGGMATVHFGRMHGAVGFQRVVAIKRLHAHFAHDAHFVEMFLDEARLASRLKHPNVISTVDVVADGDEVFLVMELVVGESLEALMPRDGQRAIPLSIVAAILCNVLEGLHGAHEALSDAGEPLGIVHRDVSPHNVIVGEDGVSRVFDFGIAKAAINTQETREGVIKGKVTYMAPEQVIGVVDRRADVYAAGVILWELLVGRRRHAGERNDALFVKLATNALDPLPPASELRLDVPEGLDAIIACATAPDPEHRFATTRDMAVAIESVVRPAMPREVAGWVREVAGRRIDRLAEIMKRIEGDLQPRSEPSISMLARPSTASVRVVTGSLTRAGGVASSVPPFDTSVGSTGASAAPPSAKGRRSWTMPAAFLAFTAAVALVGVRTLNHPRSGETSRGAAGGAAVVAAPPGATEPVAASDGAMAASTLAAGAGVGVGAQAVASDAAAAAAASSSAAGASAGMTAGTTAGTSAATTAGTNVVTTAAAVRAPSWSPPRVNHVAPAAVAATSGATPSAAAASTAIAPAASPPAGTPAAHKASCDSPFFVGSDGIRQIKPDCM